MTTQMPRSVPGVVAARGHTTTTPSAPDLGSAERSLLVLVRLQQPVPPRQAFRKGGFPQPTLFPLQASCRCFCHPPRPLSMLGACTCNLVRLWTSTQKKKPNCQAIHASHCWEIGYNLHLPLPLHSGLCLGPFLDRRAVITFRNGTVTLLA